MVAMMDIVKLVTDVRAKSSEYLDEVTEENLRLFAESTKMIAQSVLEDYYFKIDDYYSEGPFKISDREKLDHFIDFHDGYRAKMREWSNTHEILIEQRQIPPSVYIPKIEKDNSKIVPIVVASAGTLVAFGLFFYPSKWLGNAAGPNIDEVGPEFVFPSKLIGIVVELLVIGVTYLLYKKKQEECAARQMEYESAVKKYKIQLDMERSKLVNGVIADLKTWLGNAEKYSNTLLTEFGINHHE